MADMTIDELSNMDDDAFEEMSTNLDEQIENTEEVVDEPVAVIEEGEPEVDSGSNEENAISEETEDVVEDDEVGGTEEDTLDDTKPEDDTNSEESPDSTEKDDVVDETTVDYKTSYDALMKPLKVSGKDTEVKSIEDMRNLASMGMDYSRKMRDIKPLRAVGETLAQAGIMVDGVVDEAALMRLVDINNGDPKAIAQLMADKSIDPLDMETENVDYTPTQTMATHQSIEIADVEKELVSRGSVDSIVTELDKLDDKSKQFFNETPANLLKLDDDIKSGTYEKIMGAVQYEKSLGRMNGMSDMDAYIQLASQDVPRAETPAPKPVKAKPSVEKRKAAGITSRSPVKNQVPKTYDYANMSDEEFEKLAGADLQY